MKTLSKAQVEEKFGSNSNAVLINVLAQESFDQEHIPGSINIPFDSPDFVAAVKAKVKPDQEVAVYCAHKECTASEKAAAKLEQAGYKNVSDFAGGLKEWKDAGGKTKTGACSSDAASKGACGSTGSCG